jgi:hypothetical protein
MRLLQMPTTAAARCGCRRPLLEGPPILQRRGQATAAAGSRAAKAEEEDAEEEEEEHSGPACEEAGELLKRVVASRHSAKTFDTSRSVVPDKVLADVLAMTLVRCVRCACM